MQSVASLPAASSTWTWRTAAWSCTDPCEGPEEDEDEDGPPPTLYPVGPWPQVLIDPSVWGFGTTLGVLQLTVKAATSRPIQFQCANLSGWVPSRGMRPRLLRAADGQHSATALADMESGQKRSWADMMAAPGSSRTVRVPDQELMEIYEANWMRESPARLLPRQRVQQAAAVAAALTLQRRGSSFSLVSQHTTTWRIH